MDFSVFGESHGEEIGAVLTGFPAGVRIDEGEIAKELVRRAGGDALSTLRKERDDFRIISGVFEGFSTGAPICIIIPNEDVRSGDYDRFVMRPNHADYAAFVKFGGHNDYRGGGHFSARLTAPIVAIGAIVKGFLRDKGIEILSEVLTPSDEEILRAKEEQDSIGGCVKIVANGLPAGLGDNLESELARLFFEIPAVKAVEFGAGVGFAKMRGSEANVGFLDANINHCGGILGGITSGMPIIARVTFKPTPSIGKLQETVEFDGEKFVPTTIQIKGRHDPCVAKRGAVVCEAMMALGLGNLI